VLQQLASSRRRWLRCSSCGTVATIILGIDTATWTAAVGVVRDGVVLAEGVHRESRSHTASLPGLVERVLDEAGVRVEDVEGVAVSIGPGSFTGLRVGLALAKGIAFAGGLPVVGVPTLEGLAWVADAAPGDTICAALDARKQEVYAALFAAATAGPRRLTPDLALRPQALAARLPAPCVLVGDAGEVYGEILGAHATLRPMASHHPRGGVIARLGGERLAAGERPNPGALEPVYVRLPDAELPRPR
jgi:tRNA threonylcarbamoyladenosine biosynthesis protein TsaB